MEVICHYLAIGKRRIKMKKITILLLIVLGSLTSFVVAGGTAPPPPSPTAMPALDAWGIVGLAVLLPLVAFLVKRKK